MVPDAVVSEPVQPSNKLLAANFATWPDLLAESQTIGLRDDSSDDQAHWIKDSCTQSDSDSKRGRRGGSPTCAHR